MKIGYKEISDEDERIAFKQATSLESKNEYGPIEYIGSKMSNYLNCNNGQAYKITDYFKDPSGAYWYANRMLIPSGDLISMEEFIFGRKLPKKIL